MLFVRVTKTDKEKRLDAENKDDGETLEHAVRACTKCFLCLREFIVRALIESEQVLRRDRLFFAELRGRWGAYNARHSEA